MKVKNWVVGLVIAVVIVGGIVGLVVEITKLSPATAVPEIDEVGVTTSSVGGTYICPPQGSPTAVLPSSSDSQGNSFLNVGTSGAKVVPQVPAAAKPVDDSASLTADEKTIYEAINGIREAQSLPDLVDVSQLNVAAGLHAQDLATERYFAHNSPTGISYTFWAKAAGYSYTYYGENLAEGFNNPQDIVSAWLASPDHYANIVDAHYTETGLGEATGTYEGKVVTFVVQTFGAPAN